MIPNAVQHMFTQARKFYKSPKDLMISELEEKGSNTAINDVNEQIRNFSAKEKADYVKKTRAALEKARQHCVNELKTIYKANYKSNTALLNNLREYTFNNATLPEPKYTEREYKDRQTLSEVARKKYFNIVTGHYIDHSYNLEYIGTSSSFERAVKSFFPKPPYNEPKLIEKLEKDMDLMASRDPNTLEARKAYFENRIKGVMRSVEKVIHARNDAEYVKLMDKETFNDLMSAGEMQWSNKDGFVTAFGLGKEVPDPDHPGKTKMEMFIELDSDLMKKWEEMAPFFVDSTSTVNRFAYISNPDYPVMSVKEAADIREFAKDKFDKKEYDEVGICTEEDDLRAGAYRATPVDKKDPKTFPLGHIYANATIDLMQPEFIKMIQKSLLSYELKNSFGLNSKDAHFRTIDGEEISVDKAVDNMFAQKTVDVFDKDGKFVQRYERGSADRFYSGIKETEKYAVIDYVKAKPAELKATFRSFSKLADAGTHWYMSTSDEYRNFRTALKELNAHDMQDRAKTEELMNKVAKTAEAYMKLKEEPGTEFSSNTDLRYKAAQMISARMKYAVSELHKTLEAENASKEQEQQIPGGQGGNNNVQGNQLDEQMIIEELAPQKDPMLNQQPGQENVPKESEKEQVQETGEKTEEKNNKEELTGKTV